MTPSLMVLPPRPGDVLQIVGEGTRDGFPQEGRLVGVQLPGNMRRPWWWWWTLIGCDVVGAHWLMAAREPMSGEYHLRFKICIILNLRGMVLIPFLYLLSTYVEGQTGLDLSMK